MNPSKKDLNIRVMDIKDLLIAPPEDPLSDIDYIQSGEAALPRAIRYINQKEYKDISAINIYSPSLETDVTTLEKVRHMIHHYLHFQIKEDDRKMIVFKRNTARIFRNAVIFLVICMSIVTILGMESFLPNLPPLMRSVLVEGFTVVGWVIMWRPIELFMNQWTGLKLENRMYQQLLKAEIRVSSINE